MNPFNLTGDNVWDSLHRSNIAPTPHAVDPLCLQSAAIITWYQDAAALLNNILFTTASTALLTGTPGFWPPPPANPNSVPTPPYQYTSPTVIPYREPPKPTNPKVNEPRVLELYNQGKSEDDLLRMFVHMSYEDLKRIVGTA